MMLMEMPMSTSCSTKELASDYGEPDGYDEAVGEQDAQHWRKASLDEVNNFLKHVSWQKVSRIFLKTVHAFIRTN